MPTPSEDIFYIKLEAFEACEGKILPSTIDNRYEEVRLAYANANSNFYPAVDSDIDKRIKLAAHEVRTRSLYEYFRDFEMKQETEERAFNTLLQSPTEIMQDVRKLRDRIKEMNLTAVQTLIFHEHVDHIARRAFKTSDVGDEEIDRLLGTAPTPPQKPAASPSTPKDPKL